MSIINPKKISKRKLYTMKFAIRLLNQFGTNPRDVYNTLSRVFTLVEVHEETVPYLHYHCSVEYKDKCEIQAKQALKNLLRRYTVNKLIRSKDNWHITQIDNESAYQIYIRKQNGRSYDYNDAQIEQFKEEEASINNYINPKDIDCQFSPIPKIA